MPFPLVSIKFLFCSKKVAAGILSMDRSWSAAGLGGWGYHGFCLCDEGGGTMDFVCVMEARGQSMKPFNSACGNYKWGGQGYMSWGQWNIIIVLGDETQRSSGCQSNTCHGSWFHCKNVAFDGWPGVLTSGISLVTGPTNPRFSTLHCKNVAFDGWPGLLTSGISLVMGPTNPRFSTWQHIYILQSFEHNIGGTQAGELHFPSRPSTLSFWTERLIQKKNCCTWTMCGPAKGCRKVLSDNSKITNN